jgi:hypothetical protein
MDWMFKFLDLPYEKTFACASIDIPQETNKPTPFSKRPGLQPKLNSVAVYGQHVFILHEEAIKQIRLVCAGDVQNVVIKLIGEILAGKNLAEVKLSALRDKFRVVEEGVSLDVIEKALRWADENKDGRPYAEARLFRPLWTGDGEWAEPAPDVLEDAIDHLLDGKFDEGSCKGCGDEDIEF